MNFSADFTVIKSFFMAFSRRTETIQIAATFVGVFIGTYVVCYAFDMIDSQLWAKAKHTLNMYLYYSLDMAVNLTCYQVARIICGMFIRNIKLKQHKVQIVLIVSVVSGLISTLAFYAMSMTTLIRLPRREVAAMWHFAEVVPWRIAFEIVGHWLDSEMKAPRSQIARYFRRHVILLVRLFCAKVVSYPVTHNLANIFDESINYLMKQPRYWLIDDFKAGFVTLVMKMC